MSKLTLKALKQGVTEIVCRHDTATERLRVEVLDQQLKVPTVFLPLDKVVTVTPVYSPPLPEGVIPKFNMETSMPSGVIFTQNGKSFNVTGKLSGVHTVIKGSITLHGLRFDYKIPLVVEGGEEIIEAPEAVQLYPHILFSPINKKHLFDITGLDDSKVVTKRIETYGGITYSADSLSFTTNKVGIAELTPAINYMGGVDMNFRNHSRFVEVTAIGSPEDWPETKAVFALDASYVFESDTPDEVQIILPALHREYNISFFLVNKVPNSPVNIRADFEGDIPFVVGRSQVSNKNSQIRVGITPYRTANKEKGTLMITDLTSDRVALVPYTISVFDSKIELEGLDKPLQVGKVYPFKVKGWTPETSVSVLAQSSDILLDFDYDTGEGTLQFRGTFKKGVIYSLKVGTYATEAPLGGFPIMSERAYMLTFYLGPDEAPYAPYCIQMPSIPAGYAYDYPLNILIPTDHKHFSHVQPYEGVLYPSGSSDSKRTSGFGGTGEPGDVANVHTILSSKHYNGIPVSIQDMSSEKIVDYVIKTNS